jgi:hypothetical protein
VIELKKFSWFIVTQLDGLWNIKAMVRGGYFKSIVIEYAFKYWELPLADGEKRLVVVQPVKEAVEYSHSHAASGIRRRYAHGADLAFTPLIFGDTESHELTIPLDTQQGACSNPEARHHLLSEPMFDIRIIGRYWHQEG